MKRILSILLSLIMLILYIFTIPAFALDRQPKIISGGAREATEEQMAGVEEKVHPAQQTRSIYIYESERLGFSVTISGIGQDEIIAEETDTCVNFYHVPSREKYGGEVGSIEIVFPRSDFFSRHYDDMAYQIIAMGENQVFLWRNQGGGAHTGGEFLDSFRRVSAAFSMENLRKGLVPAQPDAWPTLQTTRHLAYLPVNDKFAHPDAPLTRGDLAQMLYALLDAGNKSDSHQSLFSDMAGKDCARAVTYLASYGILTGYADGTFRPDAPVSRAVFAVLLHRCQFAAPVGQYGEKFEFADVPAGHWAEKYIYSAKILGWMHGSADGLFHPEQEITYAEAVTAINRMLGRDESVTELLSVSNPFSDLAESHWAYMKVLEAAGELKDHLSVPGTQETSVPENTSAYYFNSATDGWAVSKVQLFHTTDGGKNWDKVGTPFTFTVSGLFFFSDQEGVLLGKNEETSCILLKTSDGGETWNDLLADPATRADYLPLEQFPTEKSLMESIVSAELRPASEIAAYLTIRYCPYESIHMYDFEATRQVVITAGK